MKHRLLVRGFAASTLDGVGEIADAAEELGEEDAPRFRLLAEAYTGSALVFEARDGEALWWALRELANCEDAHAEKRDVDADEARMARAACNGLGTLASKALRIWHAARVTAGRAEP